MSMRSVGIDFCNKTQCLRGNCYSRERPAPFRGCQQLARTQPPKLGAHVCAQLSQANSVPRWILGPSLDATRCDESTVSGPLLVRDADCWRMWYYCRDHNFPASEGAAFGYVASATSTDGYSWERVEGPLEGGAVLRPQQGEPAFDSDALACSTVLRHGDEWWMYYAARATPGSAWQTSSLHPMLPTRAGLAVSKDGLNWTRRPGPCAGGSVLDVGAPGDFDELYIGWPTVKRLSSGVFLMLYHSARSGEGFTSPQFQIGSAISSDGVVWEKQGPCSITRDEGTDAAFDVRGYGTRDFLEVPETGELLLFSDGLDKDLKHQLAVLKSTDQGRTWHIVQSKAIHSAVDVGAGAPCVVLHSDSQGAEEWRCYCMKYKPRQEGDYPASGHGDNQMGISMAVSRDGPLGPYVWPDEV